LIRAVDEPRPSLTQEEALRNAPDALDGHFRVPGAEGGYQDDFTNIDTSDILTLVERIKDEA